MVTQKTLLECRDLEIGYSPNISILNGLNISLTSGKLNCLMGPNGIGKSTLIRTLCGLQDPLDGSILIENSTASHADAQDRSKKISVVLTDKVAGGNLNVREFLELGRYPYSNWLARLDATDEERIKNAVEIVSLGDLLNKKLHELSDGQLQRVQIGRALVQDGEIMILDEPTAHLDVNNRVEVMKLLKQMAHEMHKAVLVSTHDLDLAVRLADNIILISPEGDIIQGVPEDLILSGKMDEIFQLKGFSLKTGENRFYSHNDNSVTLFGEGYAYLWVKNALERNGYRVGAEKELKNCIASITVINDGEFLIRFGDKSNSEIDASTIEQVLQELVRL